MKGWKLSSPCIIEEKDLTESEEKSCKVKIVKALISLPDVLRYNGEIEVSDKVLGSEGVGVISEIDNNILDLKKGDRVYVEPYKNCGECFNCKSDEKEKCSNVLVAGEDYDGFLSDFLATDVGSLFALPESVSSFDALFIRYVSLAVSLVDKLNIQKGDYVSIVGANNFSIILSEILIYYQAIPILLDTNEEYLEIGRKSGIYYTIGQDEVWQKEVASLTGGRMTNKVVYVSDCDIPVVKAFSLASFNADFAFTGSSPKSTSISFTQAIKKQLVIHCIDSGIGYTATSLNLLANKAIDFSHLKIVEEKYENVKKIFSSLNDKFSKGERIEDTTIDII